MKKYWLLNIAFIVMVPSILLVSIKAAHADCNGSRTNGDDVIVCDANPPNPAANDVSAIGGNDTITVEAGAIVNNTNSPADDSSIAGGAGNDTITNNGTTGADIDGGANDDVIVNNGVVGDDLRGGSGNDTITNSSTGVVVDNLNGDAGDDTIVNDGFVGRNLEGNDGNDTIVNNGNVVVFIRGGAGNDHITNNSTTNNDVEGGDGDDIIINNGTALDVIEGENGNDTIINNGYVATSITGGAGNDHLTNNNFILNKIAGGADDDTLVNNGIADDLEGEDGDDILVNNGTIDNNVDGGNGNDTIIINGYTETFVLGGAGNDTITNNGRVDNDIEGGDGDDTIYNNGIANDHIEGGGGDDTVVIRFGSTVGGIIYGGETGETLGDTLTFSQVTQTVANAIQSQCPNPENCIISVNGYTYNVLEFENLAFLIMAIARQLESQGIAITEVPGPSVVCDGSVKVFRLPNNDLQVYSGFELLNPNGFLVATIPGDQGVAGNTFSNPAAPVRGWHATLNSDKYIHVFDANGNLVNNQCMYRD